MALEWFVERKAYTRQSIDGFFSQHHRLSLLGAPGVGKSALAFRFALDAHYYQKYKGIFWINASNQISFDRSFIDLARHLFDSTEEKMDAREIISQVIQELDNRDNWLLIFDNLE